MAKVGIKAFVEEGCVGAGTALFLWIQAMYSEEAKNKLN